MDKSKYYIEYHIKPHYIPQKENLEKTLDMSLPMESQDRLDDDA